LNVNAKFQESECIKAPSSLVTVKSATWLPAVDFLAAEEHLECLFHAVERVPPDGPSRSVQFIPIHFTFINKLTKNDKLILAKKSWSGKTGQVHKWANWFTIPIPTGGTAHEQKTQT
jgi:hypothetical protein